MFRTRPVAITVVALAVSLPVAACGGGEDEESFKEDYNAAVKPLTELNSDIGDSLGGAGGQSNEAIAKEFDKLASKAQETRDNLADLEPPEEAKQAFDDLVSALQDGTDDLKAVAEAAKSGNPTQAQRAAQDLVKSGTEIQEAETALQKAVDG
jgi:hypothetical protein